MKMSPITTLLFCAVAAVAQLQTTRPTSLEGLTEALIGLGLPNATKFVTPDEMQNASMATNETTPAGCLLACHLLRNILNLNNSLPTNYDPASEYWAKQQQEIVPTCFVTPGTTPYVAGSVLVLNYFQCPYAVKSGGSAPVGSNIADPGVVIDLRTFNTIALSRDRSVVTIGTGQNWGAVIDGIGILGYMVPAAYDADLGVGGFIMKGGISFASSRYGMAADNVVQFEVVTANGSIMNARLEEHTDLYWSLRTDKGGGIVTRFDLSTFEVPPQVFGGIYSTALEDSQSVYEAFEDFILHGQTDNAAQFVCTVRPSGTHAILSHLDGRDDSPAFSRLLAVPSTETTLKVQTMSSFAREIAAISPRGNRELFTTFTVKINATWMHGCSQIFIDEVGKLRNQLQDGLLEPPGLSFDSLSPGITNRAKGLPSGGGPWLIAHLRFGWLDAQNDEIVRQTAAHIVSECIGTGETGPYTYPGYAALA